MTQASLNTGHGRETVVPDGVFIYSRTDLKGTIVEANQAFAEISGYTPEEMIGKPHSIVRHPDMPKEAFADLWRDLKAGRPWRGLVKNRRKDGGYYWVVANASPVREHGQIVGYQSVRGCPTREEVAAAEAAYTRIRNGDRSLFIEFGRVVRRQAAWQVQLSSFCAQLIFITLGYVVPSLLLLLKSFVGVDLGLVADGIAAIALLYGLFFIGVYACRTNRLLDHLGNWLESILTTGDLRPRLKSSRRDVIGRVVRRADKMGSSLRATLQGLIDVEKQVGESTRRVTAKVDDISDAVRHQSDVAMKSAANIEELVASVAEVADRAHATIEVAKEAGRISGEGAKVTREASEAIRALSENVKQMAAQVERLGQRSEEIDQVTGVIKEIADQTNLLALNAAIEAARAGEQGRVFAVVADEVRKLAERTSQSTQEIGSLVATIQQETRATVEGMRAGAERVDQGVRLSSDAEQALQSIQSEMARTQERVEEIAHATQEQRSTLNEVAQAVQQVSLLCQQNSEAANDTQATVHELNTAVSRMERAVKQYSL